MEYLAVETAERVELENENIGVGPFFDRMLEARARVLQLEKEPDLYITDMGGRSIFSRPPQMGGVRRGQEKHQLAEVPAEVFEKDDTVQKLAVNGVDVYAVKSPLMNGEEQVGWVVLVQTADELTNVKQEYRLLIILLVGLGLLGWIVIYFLSKKILRPIQNVAKAATQIREGNYDINLNTSTNEQEIYELVSSFEEMTNRLMQLEKLRAELLAGITHDLKTPVTSISGLVQAVRDGVVTGDESKEFLDITLNEVHRLQTMIADLLDFNSLSAGAFTIRPEHCNMNELIQNIVRQWSITQAQPIHPLVKLPKEIIYRTTDPLRLQQILINLLNNSYQALGEDGEISVVLSEDSLDIIDTGSGIPEGEKPYVFKRFFRGEKKKLKIRGLGLGLPFSKMLAKALGADLILKESTSKGSTFSIIWEKKKGKAG